MWETIMWDVCLFKSEPELCTYTWTLIANFQTSAYHISFIKRGLCVRAGVAENLWLKRKTAEEEEEANPHVSCPYNNNPAFTLGSTILSKWSYPHHSHVSTMWFEIIVRDSQPTWIQDEAFGEQNNQNVPLKIMETHFLRLWWAQTRRGVFPLSDSCYYLNICLIHST